MCIRPCRAAIFILMLAGTEETPWIVPDSKEMTMAMYFPLAAPSAASFSTSTAKPGFWRRVFEAMAQSRRRRAEAEIAHYIHGAGGFTDSVEREIERRFLSNPSRPL